MTRHKSPKRAAAIQRRRISILAFGATAGYALLVAAPLLVSPIAWHHHHVLLLPALLILIRRRERWVALGLGVFALLTIAHFPKELGLRPYGLLGLGTLAVYGCLGWAALSGGRVGAAPTAAGAPASSSPASEEPSSESSSESSSDSSA